MIRALLTMIILAVVYAGFTMFFRGKRCAGNCGACQGSCEYKGEGYDNH